MKMAARWPVSHFRLRLLHGARLPELPRVVITLAINRTTGDCHCLGQQLVMGPTRLGPVVELETADVSEGPALARLLLADGPPLDEASKHALDEVLKQGLLRIVPEHLWMKYTRPVLN